MASPRPTVLVLDDNRGNRHFAQILLKPAGYDVLQAVNMEEALELLASRGVDLVLADVRMPGGGGFELYEALRGGAHAATPFLLMSASLAPEDAPRAAQYPGLTLAERPVDPDEFVALVKAAIPR